jgi:GntR family transcriptional regulator / MocR family aminotransferase
MLSELLLIGIQGLRQQSTIPLHRQLYDVLKRAIADGRLAPGERLPSSRTLSKDLKFSRNTVIASLNQLIVEGYLCSRTGSGTYVNESLPSHSCVKQKIAHTQCRPSLSKRGEKLATTFLATDHEVQPFPPGVADFSAFPIALWQRLQNKHWRMTYPAMLDYNASGGHAPLRRAVADYLRIFRSVQLDVDQVIITNGSQQSLQLCAKLLADPGDTVWIEDPAYWGAIKSFMANDLTLYPIKVDADGIAPTEEDQTHQPRLIYTTPSHQYPTGSVMTMARRQALLQMADRHDAFIIEDDYDSEFRFTGHPLSSLSGLDRNGRVLYMGSFSKVLYPGLKLGYLIVPKSLVQSFKLVHYDLNRPGQLPVQAALAEFIELGHFTSALRKARASHCLRRQCLLELLEPCLKLGAIISGAEQGLHLCLHLPPHMNDKQLTEKIAQKNILVRPLSAYCVARTDIKGLIIGYGYAPLSGVHEFGPILVQVIVDELKK